ncbi:MAG: preprotein translocase subunit YidC [Parcubacteria group bacterium Greene0714_36]|nr:MAG: preprotein translocase subunit YidC [Parcubacteria group bacterium Greene0714_36]
MFLYTEFLWRPLFNALVFFYNVLPGHDLGIAIIALTAVIRLLLTPFLIKGQRAQHRLAAVQPELKAIQEKYKGDREGQGKAMMALYATHKINPLSGCLILLIQLPILIALLQVFRLGFDPSSLAYLYSFVANPGTLDPHSFGVLDLSQGNIFLGVAAAITQFLQTKLSLPSLGGATANTPPAGTGDFAKALQWQTTYLFPLLILFWSYTLPAALTLYWTTLNILGIVQEFVMGKRMSIALWPMGKQSKTK